MQKKKIVDKLVEECNEIIDENKLHPNVTDRKNNPVVSSYCTAYLISFVVTLITGIISITVNFYWYLKKERYGCY